MIGAATQLRAPKRRSHRQSRPRPSIAQLRLRELNAIARHRHGEAIPNTPGGRALIHQVAVHMAHGLDPARRIRSWLSLRAQWLNSIDADQLIELVTGAADGRPLAIPKADTVGWALRLTIAQRDAMRLTTIGAIDDSPAKRKARRRARARARAAIRRVSHGSLPQAQSIERAAPWKSHGVSRRTWYRHQADALLADPTPNSLGAQHRVVREPERSAVRSAAGAQREAKAARAEPDGTNSYTPIEDMLRTDQCHAEPSRGVAA